IPEVWDERGFPWPKDRPIEETVFVPENAQYYAAFGACAYGLGEAEDVGRYAGTVGLVDYMQNGRKARLGESAGPPLVKTPDEAVAFADLYRIPRFSPPELTPGQVVRAVIGLDGGSTSSKAVLVDEAGEIIAKAYQLSKGNPIQDTKELLAKLKAHVDGQGA